MPLPTVFTEQTLAEYMQLKLRALGETPGWSAAGMDYEWPVNETLLEYGVSNIAQATDIRRLLALAEVMALRAVCAQLAPAYDTATDGESLKRSQMFTQATKLLELAEDRARKLGALAESTGVPVSGRLTATAPVNAPLPGDPLPYPWGPDANDARYSGSPYRRRVLP